MLNKAQVCMDAGIIGAAYFFSWYLRFKSGLFVQDAGVLPAKTYFSALFLIIPGYLLLYSIFQLYTSRLLVLRPYISISLPYLLF